MTVVFFVLMSFVLGAVFGIIATFGVRKWTLRAMAQDVRLRNAVCPMCDTYQDHDLFTDSEVAYSAYYFVDLLLHRRESEADKDVRKLLTDSERTGYAESLALLWSRMDVDDREEAAQLAADRRGASDGEDDEDEEDMS